MSLVTSNGAYVDSNNQYINLGSSNGSATILCSPSDSFLTVYQIYNNNPYNLNLADQLSNNVQFTFSSNAASLYINSNLLATSNVSIPSQTTMQIKKNPYSYSLYANLSNIFNVSLSNYMRFDQGTIQFTGCNIIDNFSYMPIVVYQDAVNFTNQVSISNLICNNFTSPEISSLSNVIFGSSNQSNPFSFCNINTYNILSSNNNALSINPCIPQNFIQSLDTLTNISYYSSIPPVKINNSNTSGWGWQYAQGMYVDQGPQTFNPSQGFTLMTKFQWSSSNNSSNQTVYKTTSSTASNAINDAIWLYAFQNTTGQAIECSCYTGSNLSSRVTSYGGWSNNTPYSVSVRYTPTTSNIALFVNGVNAANNTGIFVNSNISFTNSYMGSQFSGIINGINLYNYIIPDTQIQIYQGMTNDMNTLSPYRLPEGFRNIAIDIQPQSTNFRTSICNYNTTSLLSNVYITQTLSNYGNISCISNVQFNQQFSNLGNVSFSSNLIVTQTLSNYGNINCLSNVQFNQQFSNLGNVSFSSNLIVNQTVSNYGNASFSNYVFIAGVHSNIGNVAMSSNLTVLGCVYSANHSNTVSGYFSGSNQFTGDFRANNMKIISYADIGVFINCNQTLNNTFLNSFSLAQNSSGMTYINSAFGQPIYFTQNGVLIMQINTYGGLSLNTSNTNSNYILDVGGATRIQNTLYATGGYNLPVNNNNFIGNLSSLCNDIGYVIGGSSGSSSTSLSNLINYNFSNLTSAYFASNVSINGIINNSNLSGNLNIISANINSNTANINVNYLQIASNVATISNTNSNLSSINNILITNTSNISYLSNNYISSTVFNSNISALSNIYSTLSNFNILSNNLQFYATNNYVASLSAVYSSLSNFVGLSNSLQSYSNNTTANFSNISTYNITNKGQINFSSQIQPNMICLYGSNGLSDTSNCYGFGITNYTLNYNTPYNAHHQFNINGNELARIHSNGYIGISNNNPQFPLQVTMSNGSGGGVCFNSPYANEASIRWSNTLQSWIMGIGSYGSGSNFCLGSGVFGGILFATHSGNIGIVNNNPQYPLDVNGPARITGTLYPTNSISMISNDNTYIGINAASFPPTLGIAKKYGYGPVFAATSNALMNFGYVQSTTLADIGNSNLSIYMSLSNNGYLNVTGGLLLGTSTDTSRSISALYQNFAANSTSYFTLGQSASLYNEAEIGFNYIASNSTQNVMGLGLWGNRTISITGPSNVGINCIPALSLDVNGPIRTNNQLNFYNQGSPNMLCLFGNTNLADSSNNYGFGISNSTLLYNVDQNGHHQFMFKGTELCRITSNGFGVFNTNPAFPIDINGNQRLNNPSSRLYINSTGGGQGNLAGIEFTTYGFLGSNTAGQGLGSAIYAQDDGSFGSSLIFQSKPSGAGSNPSIPRMFIADNGNVGVGNNYLSPGTLFDVYNGTIRAYGTGTGNVNQISITTPYLSTGNFCQFAIGTSNTNYNCFTINYYNSGGLNATTGNYALLQYFGSSSYQTFSTYGIGINTTQASYAFDCAGQSRFTTPIIQNAPITYRYNFTTNTNSTSGWQAWSFSYFGFQTTGSYNVTNNLFQQANVPAAATSGTVGPQFVMPYSGLWHLQLQLRWNAASGENAIMILPMISSYYGETNNNANNTRLAYTGYTGLNCALSLTFMASAGDTFQIAAYSATANYFTTGFYNGFNMTLVNRTS